MGKVSVAPVPAPNAAWTSGPTLRLRRPRTLRSPYNCTAVGVGSRGCCRRHTHRAMGLQPLGSHRHNDKTYIHNPSVMQGHNMVITYITHILSLVSQGHIYDSHTDTQYYEVLSQARTIYNIVYSIPRTQNHPMLHTQLYSLLSHWVCYRTVQDHRITQTVSLNIPMTSFMYESMATRDLECLPQRFKSTFTSHSVVQIAIFWDAASQCFSEP